MNLLIKIKVNLKTSWKFYVWLAFLGFTILILVYPVNLRLETAVVWSSDIFPNLLLFGSLFYIWTALLVLILFASTKESIAKWERLVLITIVSLIFRGFWNIISPIQGQSYTHLIATKIWQNLGYVIPHPSVGGYINWPSVSLISSAFSQIIGLEIIISIKILTIFIAIVIGIASYVFLLNVVNSSLLASLASLLIIAGNLALVIYHNAGPTAIVFVVLFLVILFKKRGIDGPSYIIATLILLMGATITHLPSAMNFFFFFLGIYSFSLFRHHHLEFKPTITILSLFFIIPIVWSFYCTPSTLRDVSQYSVVIPSKTPTTVAVSPTTVAVSPTTVAVSPTTALGTPSTLVSFTPKWISGSLTMWQANFGEFSPLWYKLTRLFWLVLLYAMGGLVWLWNLRKPHQLISVESKLSAAFCGLIFMNLMGSIVSPRGSGELQRALTYIPFFTVPLLVLFFHRLNPLITKVAMRVASIVFIILSLPSFLATNPRINILNPHRTESSTGKWLYSLYGTGEGLQIYITHPSMGAIQSYLYKAAYVTDPEAESRGFIQQSRWKAMDELLDNYARSSQNGNRSFFIHSLKMAVVSNSTFNIPLDHPRWKEIADYLSNKNSQIYDNGPIQIYSH